MRIRYVATLSGMLALSIWGLAAEKSKAQDVLSDLHQSNQMEIQMGKMAKEKGASDQVRSYGDQLVRDHQDADNQVQDLAKKDGITLVAPASTGIIDKFKISKHQTTMADLSNKTGAAFDKAFADEMIDDHKRDISKLEDAQKTVDQADVRNLITKLLPTLQQHLQRAEQIKGNS